MESFDDIRKEIALRHNVRIGRDDPVLVGMTLQEIGQERFLALVSERYEAASRELVDALSRQMSALLQQHRDEAGKTAEKLVNEASDFIDNRMRSAVTESLAEVRAEIDNSLAAARTACRNTTDASYRADAAKAGTYIAAFVASLAAIAAIAACAAIIKTA